MNGLNAVFKRELISYFITPVAYVFLAIFLLAVNALAFYMGSLYEAGEASLRAFFMWVPWVMVFLLPAISMRLWAEEKRSGTIEPLMSLPIPLWQIVLGKYLAAWVFSIIAIILTFPIWITVSYLGNPDHGLIVSGYWGTVLLAGAYISIGTFLSSLTQNQVIAFVLSVFFCFISTVFGSPVVLVFFEGWLPGVVVQILNNFSFLTHFQSMNSGIISFPSIFYFLSHIAFWNCMTFLALGHYRLIFKSTNCYCRRTTVVVAVVFFLAFNFVAGSMKTLQIDMTADKLYTLSSGTKELLAGLKAPLNVRFFFSRENSKDMPSLQAYATRIQSLLEQYKNLSKDKIRLSIIDPQPFSEDEDLAVKYRIQALPLDERGRKLYFGISVSNVDNTKDEPIRFLNPQREPLLEYDITKLIDDMAGDKKKPKLGVISSFNMKTQDEIVMPVIPGFMPEDWNIIHQIRHHFDVTHFKSDVTAIPSDLSVLMIVHPPEMSDETLYAIDQFILAGGKAMIFTDPKSESQSADPKSSNFTKLYNAWGINMDSDHVVLDYAYNARSNISQANTRLKSIQRLNWIALPNVQMNESDPVTASLNLVRLNSVGYFMPLTHPASIVPSFRPLLETSKKSSLWKSDNLDSAQKLIDQFVSDNRSYLLAGRLQGEAFTAFPEKSNLKGHLEQSEGDINVIVVADSDILRDALWLDKRPFYGNKLAVQKNDNAAFIINSLESLTGSERLISLRSRSKVQRPFTVVAKLRRNAEEKFLSQEKRLQDRLQSIEISIRNTEKNSEGLTKEQQEERAAKFREETLATRKELRRVQYELNKDIEGLGTFIKALNIALLPILVILLSFIFPRYLGVKRRL